TLPKAWLSSGRMVFTTLASSADMKLPLPTASSTHHLRLSPRRLDASAAATTLIGSATWSCVTSPPVAQRHALHEKPAMSSVPRRLLWRHQASGAGVALAIGAPPAPRSCPGPGSAHDAAAGAVPKERCSARALPPAPGAAWPPYCDAERTTASLSAPDSAPHTPPGRPLSCRTSAALVGRGNTSKRS